MGELKQELVNHTSGLERLLIERLVGWLVEWLIGWLDGSLSQGEAAEESDMPGARWSDACCVEPLRTRGAVGANKRGYQS